MPPIAQTTSLDDLVPSGVQVAVVLSGVLAWGLWMRAREAKRFKDSPLKRRFRDAKPEAVHPRPSNSLRRIATGLALQALLFGGLTVAFAALLRISGPQTWTNALRFAGLNWMPWAVLAPVVFWFSGRFPFERGMLWRSIPAHIVGCAGCVILTVWVAAYVGYVSRPSRFEEHRGFIERPVGEHEVPSGAASADRGAPPGEYSPPAFERNDRPERFMRGEPRPPFGRRNGPFWWPFLGATLLRANFDAAVYLIVVFAAHALAFYRRAQEREQHATALAAGLSRAKLDALRLQLQPHFLFNTLNAISTLVHRDASAADELIGDLSDLLRLSLQTTDHEVPLVRELELLERYLAIEQARLGDRLRIVREIEPGTEKALVPTLLLQPLTENAIRHGIEPRLAAGTVRISARREGEQLVLIVSDDGVGLRPAQETIHRRGIGITNTEERLRTLHGDAAQLTLTTPKAGGVEVKVTLPFTTTPRRASGEETSGAAPSPAPSGT